MLCCWRSGRLTRSSCRLCWTRTATTSWWRRTSWTARSGLPRTTFSPTNSARGWWSSPTWVPIQATILCSASYASWQRGTARICCCASCCDATPSSSSCSNLLISFGIGPRCTQARKTTHCLDGQHQDVDRTPRGRVSQNDRGLR